MIKENCPVERKNDERKMFSKKKPTKKSTNYTEGIKETKARAKAFIINVIK